MMWSRGEAGVAEVQARALRSQLRRLRLCDGPAHDFGVVSPARCIVASDHIVVCGTSAGALALFDAETNELKSLVGRAHTGAVASLDLFSSNDDGAFASVGGRDCLLRVWDTIAMEHVMSASLTAKHTYCARMRENMVVVGCDAGQAVVIDVGSGRTSHSVAGHSGPILSAAWSPVSAHCLATGGADGCIRLWDLRRVGACFGSLDLMDQEHTSVGDADSGKRLHLSGPAQAHSLVRAHVGRAVAVEFVGGGNELLSLGSEGALRLWRRTAGLYRNAFVDFATVQGDYPLGTRLATVEECDCVVVPREGGVELSVMSWQTGEAVRPGLGAGHMSKIGAVCHSRGGGVYSVGDDGLLLRWQPRDEHQADLSGHDNEHDQLDRDEWSDDDDGI